MRECAGARPAAIIGRKELLKLLDKTARGSIIAMLLSGRTRLLAGLDGVVDGAASRLVSPGNRVSWVGLSPRRTALEVFSES